MLYKDLRIKKRIFLICFTLMFGYCSSSFANENCIDIPSIVSMLSTIEAEAKDVSYTYRTSLRTKFRPGFIPAHRQVAVGDMEGTATSLGNNYYFQMQSVPNSVDPQPLQGYGHKDGVSTFIMYGSKSASISSGDQHRSRFAQNTPLARYLVPPWGDVNGTFSQFFDSELKHGPIETTCTVENGQKFVYVGNVDFRIRMNLSKAGYPDLIERYSGKVPKISMRETVTSFTTVEGIVYPTEILSQKFATDETGTNALAFETTASLDIIKTGKAVVPKDIEVVIPDDFLIYDQRIEKFLDTKPASLVPVDPVQSKKAVAAIAAAAIMVLEASRTT